MRIVIVRKLTPLHINPLSDQFQPGRQYDVSKLMGHLFITEGWARAVIDEPHLIAPSGEMDHGSGPLSPTRNHRQGAGPSLKDAIEADIALDCAIAEAIERQARS